MSATEKSPAKQHIKQRIWEIFEVAQPGDRLSKICDFFIIVLIFLNVLAVFLSTVKPLEARFAAVFYWFEVFSVLVFTLEYLARAWSCVTQKEFSAPVTGRLRFLLKPMSVIDLLAVLPFYLSFVTVDLRFMRSLRLFRIFRVAKLSRYSSSARLFGRVIKNNKEELVVTAMIMALLVVFSSSVMYFAENEAQPDRFPDIPTTMWWSVVTLTTVGYGDVYPVTALGKFFAGVIAILGIGMFALPTGILGASFVAEIQRQKAGKHVCPHCGKDVD